MTATQAAQLLGDLQAIVILLGFVVAFIALAILANLLK